MTFSERVEKHLQSPRKTEKFSKIPIFSNLTNEEIERITQNSDQLEFKEGAVIFAPGDQPDGFYVIEKGRVEIEITKSDQTSPTKIATLSNRSVFGEMSFLGGRNRSAFAIALSESKLRKFRGPEFRAMLESGDLAAYKVIHSLLLLTHNRLRVVEDELIQILDGVPEETRESKLAELQQFRQKLFDEWSF